MDQERIVDQNYAEAIAAIYATEMKVKDPDSYIAKF